MFRTRLISGIVLVILALAVNIIGGDILLAALALISLVGLYELYRALGLERMLPAFAGYAAVIVHYVLCRFVAKGALSGNAVALLLFLLLAVLMAMYVLAFPRFHADQIMPVFFGFFYVAVLMSFIYRTRMLEGGAFLIWLIIIASWGCDTAAYCVGMLIGKRKLAPVLSPKKSVEGAVGGVLGAALIAFLYALGVNIFGTADTARLWQYPLICAFGAVISQIGDLAASGIKRDHEIKDYGKLIPGHGGILDRFDSVIFTAPVIYFLASYFLNGPKGL